MIEARDIVAAGLDAKLGAFSFAVDGGLHALVGTTVDGGPLALAVLAGRVAPKRGHVLVDSKPIARSRRAVVYVGRAPVLPEALRVEQAVGLAARVRGGTSSDPASVLAALGLASLARRWVDSLDLAETKAVALAIALDADAGVVLLDEPFVALDPAAAAYVADLVRSRGNAGATVIVATASEREARRLGATVHRFRGGALVHEGADPIRGTPAPAVFRAVASDARALVGSLTSEVAVTEVAARGSSVRAAGLDPVEVAAAIGRAAVRADVDLYSLEQVNAP